MKRSSVFLALAAGLIIWGVGASEARAGQIPLPTTLNNLIGPPPTAGPYAIVGDLMFSNFTYTQVTAAPPAASGVMVSAYTGPPPGENGLTFGGAFNSPATVTNDWIIGYTVTALGGATITDALLSINGGLGGGNGSIDVSETLTNTLTGATFATMDAHINPSSTVLSDQITFAGLTSITVSKDIDVIGGASTGTTLSVINQGFSIGSVPEPASMGLLGIGMTGILAFRRLFKKKTSVA